MEQVFCTINQINVVAMVQVYYDSEIEDVFVDGSQMIEECTKGSVIFHSIFLDSLDYLVNGWV